MSLLSFLNGLFGHRPAPEPPPVFQPLPQVPALPVPDRFATCLKFTLHEEGGFVDNPADPGGATIQGITIATYRSFDVDATVEDLKAISPEEVARIYRVGYWDPIKGDQLPSGVDLMVFDMGVNSGPNHSIRLLQQACSVAVDGVIGPATLAAAQHVSLAVLRDKQEASYRSLRNFDIFGKGWLARLTRRYNLALVKS